MQANKKTVAIGLGTNLGNRLANLRQTIALLKQAGLQNLRVAVCYESHALLPAEAPESWNLPYLNTAVVAETIDEPLALLAKLKKIEAALGRHSNHARWSPREIDLDILLYDNEVVQLENLTIPHTELLNRWFALVPLAQLLPTWQHPLVKKTLHELAHVSRIDAFKRYVLYPEFVGVVNITPDSFSDGNKFLMAEKAFAQVQTLLQEGASVIDLGAQSTRPGAQLISAEEEWQRLEPVLDFIKSQCPYPITLSLDTFYLANAKRAVVEYDIAWINDLSTNLTPALAALIRDTNCKYVATHTLGLPTVREKILAPEQAPVSLLKQWAEDLLMKAKALGIAREQLILDPGLGFGKTAWQNLNVLQAENLFADLGLTLLIGHSRKSFWNLPANKDYALKDFDSACLAILSSKLAARYWRVHNVEIHQQAFANLVAFEGGYLIQR